MHVAEGTVNTCGHFQWNDIDGAVNIASGRGQNLRVARRLKQCWQEGMLRREPHQQHHIGTVQKRGEARLHGDSVEVFDPGCETFNVQQVATNVSGHVGQIRNRGHHADFGVSSRRGRQEHEPDREHDEYKTLHRLTP